MKNLENYGVQELSAREIQETDGGGFLAWALGLLAKISQGGNSYVDSNGVYYPSNIGY